jgi:putative Mg2+ transporter-C (MgtC) family protein
MLTLQEALDISSHLGAALVAGGLIGLERSYHGRDAGFRTHVLVCLSSALLMLVTLYQSRWFPDGAAYKVASDPTRMAQGIMTGIGFLGAGVIMKDGLSVKGLTTAASIWITAAIGILAGIGFYEPVIIATLLTLAALGVFRWIEAILPTFKYAIHKVVFVSGQEPNEKELISIIRTHGFHVSRLRTRYARGTGEFEYEMTLRAKDLKLVDQLRATWQAHPHVLEFATQPV